MAQAEPRQAHSSPALGGPGRQQTVGPGSALLLGPVHRETFFFLPILASIPPTPCVCLFPLAIHVAPHATRSRNNVRRSTLVVEPPIPLGLPSRSSGCPFCFTLLCAIS